MTTTKNQTAQDHLAKANQYKQDAQDSFERSDTDGFLSQWASGMMSNLEYRKYEIAENGGKSYFPALFDLEGNLVPAKLISTQYGSAWGLLEDEDNVESRFIGYFNPSNAQDDERARKNNAKKGYYVGEVMADAYATHWSPSNARGMSGAMMTQTVVLRKDKGWSKDVTIVDNGQ